MGRKWNHLLCCAGPSLTVLAHSAASYPLPLPHAEVQPTGLLAPRTRLVWPQTSLPMILALGPSRVCMHHLVTSIACEPPFLLISLSPSLINNSHFYRYKSTLVSRCVL